MTVYVYLPAGDPGSAVDEPDITVMTYESSSHLASLLAANNAVPAVILTSELSLDEQAEVADAIREHAVRAVEVRHERWDGFASSPLSAACRGVISGFGASGIGAAVAVQRA